MGEVSKTTGRKNRDDGAAMPEFDEEFEALERSIAMTVERAQQEKKIQARVHELLTVSGKEYDYCPEKARRRATAEVHGIRGG